MRRQVMLILLATSMLAGSIALFVGFTMALDAGRLAAGLLLWGGALALSRATHLLARREIARLMAEDTTEDT
jgi:hypothetical protein